MEYPIKVYDSLKEFKEDFDDNFQLFKRYFSDATFDDYKEEFKKLYYDRNEQLEYFELSKVEWELKMMEAEISGEDLDEFNNKPIAKEFQDSKGNIDEIKFKKIKYTTKSILNFIDGNGSTTSNNNIESNIEFSISQTELMELIKSLIENKSVIGKQKDIIIEFANFFNIEINNPSKLINDIKNTRNVGSETLFLDKLKDSLLDFINKQNQRY